MGLLEVVGLGHVLHGQVHVTGGILGQIGVGYGEGGISWGGVVLHSKPLTDAYHGVGTSVCGLQSLLGVKVERIVLPQGETLGHALSQVQGKGISHLIALGGVVKKVLR